MFSRIAVVALGLFATVEGASITKENGVIPGNTGAAKNILQHARRAQENEGNDVDVSFLSGYSVVFQGCHHVQQWNENADDDEDVRIMTKRLVRFRVCPAEDCTDYTGCNSGYGDYVVDMETYMESYYEVVAEMYGENNNGGVDLGDYMECSAVNVRRQLEEDYYGGNVQYYVGPYCADQGGEIRLGLFTDDTCTSFAQDQSLISDFPYTSSSMVSTSCMACSDNDGNGNVNEFCEDIYEISGKCESKMNVYYPNEAACSYIEGIKIIRADGVIRSNAGSGKSKAAAVAIGCFLTIAVLLAGYVYYLRTKLSRASINLDAASKTLT
eukprot:Nitzschia sp. Nitz4//scaffold64_size103689//27932//28909//NITZ4_004427-RA/size103689-processed-gene-0.73-mRNA-1//1//CDS//3329556103//189//frame0